MSDLTMEIWSIHIKTMKRMIQTKHVMQVSKVFY